jgi:hypothetical protein
VAVAVVEEEEEEEVVAVVEEAVPEEAVVVVAEGVAVVVAAGCPEPARGSAQSRSLRCCSRSRLCSQSGRGSPVRMRRSRRSMRCSSFRS